MANYGKFNWLVNLAAEGFELEENPGGGFVSVVDQAFPNTGTYGGSEAGGYYMDRTGTVGESALLYIEQQLNASASNTYQFQVVPGNGFGRDDFRLKLVATAGVLPFRLSAGTFGSNIMLLLGGDTTAALTDTSQEIVFPNHYYGSFMVPKEFQWNDEREKPRIDAVVKRTNSDQVYIATRNTRRDRKFRLLVAQGALVYKDRLEYAQWRDEIGITANDQYVSLETFWEEAIRQGRRFRYYKNVDTTSLDHGTTGYFECRVVDSEHIMDMTSMVEDRLTDMGKEAYDISFRARELSYLASS